MPAEKALSVMTESRDWWRPDVFGAFMRAERVFRREASEESREAPEVSVDHASIPTDL
jgi:hypothetical protein